MISEPEHRQETDMHKPAAQVFNTFIGMRLVADFIGMKSSIRVWLKKGSVLAEAN